MIPILRRELLDVLRTRRVMAMQLVLALACALLVLARWPTGEVTDLSGTRALQVLRLFGYGLLAGILLLVPAFPAASLVREKVKGTLPLLLNSPLRPWSIYLGKLGGVLGFTAALLVMTLPAAAACHALGGTTNRGGLAALYGVLFLAAVQLATLGLLVSSLAQSVDGAMRLTYALVLCVVILPLLPLFRLRGDSLEGAAFWLACLSPVPAVMEAVGQGDALSQGLSAGSHAILGYALLATVFSAACAAATVARLNSALLDRARPSTARKRARTGFAEVMYRVFFLVDPNRRAGSMSAWVNPVMVKEFRSRRFGRSHWLLRLLAISTILSLVLSYAALGGALGLGRETIGGVLVLLQVALLVLFAPSLASGLVAAERESGTWQLLRMTPLSPGAILRGKLMSVAWPLLLLLGSTIPGYVIMMLTEPTLVPRVQRVVVCLVLTAVFAVLLSAAISTLFRSAATATAASYLALLAVCGGPLLIWLGRDAPFGQSAVEAALFLDPVAASLQAAAAWDFASYELLPLNWWIIGSACLVLLVFLAARTWQLYRPE
jgi:ABC-type transport system involved in multi-copper enzyme maturation permease subunit